MSLSNTLYDALLEFLPQERVLVGDALKERFYHIWRTDVPLNAKVFVMPKTTEEISAICKICSSLQQPIIVFGGRTNLVGSTETNGDELIISMELMNKIEETDVDSRTMTVQGGVILEEIQNEAKRNDLLFPLNFGAKGSSQIGGCISTNAGGLRVLRFGMTRALVLGLEVVLMDGTIIQSMKKIIKDNSGYDVKQLFIGSEGTLGVVTKAVLKLIEIPVSRNSAFIGLNDFDKILQFLRFIDKGLAGSLSGFEFIEKYCYQSMTGETAQNKPPIAPVYNYYLLIESMGADRERDKNLMEDLLSQAIEEEIIMDAAMAHTASDFNWFWSIREDVDVIASMCTHDQHFDVSVSPNKMGPYLKGVLEEMKKVKGVEHCFAFGHIADGNMHFIVGKELEDDALRLAINEVVYRPLKDLQGSVSAEHGIGVHKKDYLSISRTDAEIALMKNLKATLDPQNLLNPGKVLA